MIQLIDKRNGLYKINNVNSEYLIDYNGEIYALKDLEVVGLKIISVILKDKTTDLIYERVIKP